MADTDEIYSEILKIKSDVRALQHQTSWLLLGQASQLAEQWRPIFSLIPGKKANFTAMKVYLAVNGRRTVSEIAREAKIHVPDASKILSTLERARLVEPLPQKTTSTKIYSKTQADWPLGISKTLQAKLTAKAALATPTTE